MDIIVRRRRPLLLLLLLGPSDPLVSNHDYTVYIQFFKARIPTTKERKTKTKKKTARAQRSSQVDPGPAICFFKVLVSAALRRGCLGCMAVAVLSRLLTIPSW